MTCILGLIAAACVIYYAVIVIYSGFATSFSFIWLVIAAVCLLFAFGGDYYVKHKEKAPLWLPVSWVTFCCTGILVFAVVEILIFTAAAGAAAPDLDYVIVLGARVREDGLSRVLKYRLDRAMEYLAGNPGAMLVLSGGQGKGEPVSEAAAMRDYLEYNGVSHRRLILEERSSSTVENIAYGRLAIEADQERRKELSSQTTVVMEPGTYEEIPDKPIKVGVLTSDFHVFRAEQIAKKWGMPDIHGISSKSDPVLFVHYCVRECAAILKDKLVGNM